MDIEEYVLQKEKRLEKGKERIKNLRVFDFSYVPQKPFMREEAKPVIDALLRYEKTGIANHLVVLGSRGCGKTLLVRHLMRLFRERDCMHFHYVNCRHHNTSFKILAWILGVKPRGVSLAELWASFCETHRGRHVFVLDEIDLLSDKDKSKEILYLISRSRQNYMALLLSNNPKFMNQLDESTRSTLQPEIVHFRNYTAPQIGKILEERARSGLRKVPRREMGKISALTVKNANSDARVAIKTLYYWALEPGVSVEENFERARRDIVVDLLNDLSDKNLLILKAASMSPERHVKDVYSRYRRLSVEMKEEPFSYVYFYSNLAYLQSLGLVVLVSTKVNRSYTNRIELAFAPELLEVLWQMRFG